ncbi:MAG: hypothetical protein CVU39_01145 [Chloroflexi bacterium HGW-Chloroflexi-10]|nr:MAG: hypothetical protein CVU39_01145 [Chloroflexi bacterium HGW-Chloroflexi-10]
MDQEGFAAYLRTRNMDEAGIAAAVTIVERYEQFLNIYLQGRALTTEDTWVFSEQLVSSGDNHYDNYLALLRYGFYTKDDVTYVGFLEMLDGEEVLTNLHHKLGDLYGAEMQAYVFADRGVPPLGTPTGEKPRYMEAVMKRLAEKFDEAGCKDLIKDSLRTLPDSMHGNIKEQYAAAGDLDAFLDQQSEAFLTQLEDLKESGKPFFAQPITQEVMDYLREHPEITRGERKGNIYYEVKIPFMTHKYINEQDETLKRYYYCHCPWAREAIRLHNAEVPASFCNCSAGFHKKRWELIFDQKIEVDVLESVLKGDLRCRFAIHLPASQ